MTHWFLTYRISNTYFQNQSFEYQKLLRHYIYTHSVSTAFLSLSYLGKSPPFAIDLHRRFVSRSSGLVWKHGRYRTLLCCSGTLFIFNPSVLPPSSYLQKESQIKGSLCSEEVETLWSLESWCFLFAFFFFLSALAIFPHPHFPVHTFSLFQADVN